MDDKLLLLNNKEIFLNYFDEYDEKFSIKKKPIYRNKDILSLKFKKKRINNSYSIWHDLPFSVLIYVSNLKLLHNMLCFLYSLNNCIIIKKHRRVNLTNINNKIITGYNCYRIYSKDFLKLYDLIEEITEYEIDVLGIEIAGKLYDLETLANSLENIKEDLNFVSNLLNDFNTDFNKIYNNLGELDQEFNQNLQQIFAICQHIIKSDEEKE